MQDTKNFLSTVSQNGKSRHATLEASQEVFRKGMESGLGLEVAQLYLHGCCFLG